MSRGTTSRTCSKVCGGGRAGRACEGAGGGGRGSRGGADPGVGREGPGPPEGREAAGERGAPAGRVAGTAGTGAARPSLSDGAAAAAVPGPLPAAGRLRGTRPGRGSGAPREGETLPVEPRAYSDVTALKVICGHGDGKNVPFPSALAGAQDGRLLRVALTRNPL